MKIHATVVALLTGSVLAMSACHTNHAITEQRQKAVVNSRETADNECFVQWKDGRVQSFKTLTLETGLFKAPCLLADGQRRIQPSEITAYQNKAHYAISQDQFQNGRKSYVAVETLPGFAVRVAKGRMNVYAKKFYNGQHAVDEYFIQDGDKGQVVACTNEVMEKLLVSDPESFDFVYAKIVNTTKSKKQLSALNSMNTRSLTKNK